jgi:hypothetical protein
MSVPLRRFLLVPFALLGVLVLPRAAHAGPIVASASDCDEQVLTQPFRPWLDGSSYYLLDGGSFADGAGSWALGAGASVAPDGEPYDVTGDGGSGSLRLGADGTATSPATCVGIGHPTMRFFVRNRGFLLGHLRVAVRFEDALGGVHALPVAELLGGANWTPTLPLPVVANLLALLPGEHTAIQLRFTAEGGSWDVDDVHVDPYRKG